MSLKRLLCGLIGHKFNGKVHTECQRCEYSVYESMLS